MPQEIFRREKHNLYWGRTLVKYKQKQLVLSGRQELEEFERRLTKFIESKEAYCKHLQNLLSINLKEVEERDKQNAAEFEALKAAHEKAMEEWKALPFFKRMFTKVPYMSVQKPEKAKFTEKQEKEYWEMCAVQREQYKAKEVLKKLQSLDYDYGVYESDWESEPFELKIMTERMYA